MSKELTMVYRVADGLWTLGTVQNHEAKPATQEDLENHLEEFKTVTDVLDRIACDPEHLKRDDMVQLAGDVLCKVGLWRKAVPGEFVRGGASYGFPGCKPQQKG